MPTLLPRLLLLCAASGAPSLPGVGPADPRVPVDPAQPPWRAIGRVQTELGGRCTGFLTGPRTVLTAAHCLYRRGPDSFVQPGSVHFLLGYTLGRYAGHARVTAFRTGPGYDPRREGATAAADWAELTLDAALGTPDRVLPLQADPPMPGTPVVLGGYGRDRAERLDADLHCTAEAVSRDAQGRALIIHGCAGTSGTSGAPLLAHSDGGWAVVGIQIAAVNGQSRGLAVAAGATR